MFSQWTAYFLFFKLLSIGAGVPLKTTSVNSVTETLDCNNENSDVYDQRQNGTENYRIHVNGVVVLIAPAETVLQAAQLGSLQLGADSEMNTPIPQTLKPKPKPPTVIDEVPSERPLKETSTIYPKDSKESIRRDSEEPLHHTNE